MRPQGAADNKQPSFRFPSPVDDPPPQEQHFELDPHSPPPVLDSGTTEDKIRQPEAMEDKEKPPSVLDMDHFRSVKDLIHREIEDELLRIEDGDKKRPVNLMNDPVLNVVIACKKTKLAIRLIKKMLPERLMNKNYFHDTALHVAASMDNVDVAEALIRANKDLVNELNKKQETPLHKAAQNGLGNMFWCLINGGGYPNARRWDGATMLHCAIMGNAPDLALEIAKQYGELITSRNENAVTPLQIMVTIPDLFRSKLVLGSFDNFIYNWIPLEADYSQNRRKGDEEDAVNKSRNRIEVIDDEEDDDDAVWKMIRTKFPSSYSTFFDLFEMLTIPVGWTRLFLFNILRPISYRIQSLERKKKKHKQAMELTAFLAQPQYMEFHESGKTGSDEAEKKSLPQLGEISSPNIQDVQQTKKDKDDAEPKDLKGLIRKILNEIQPQKDDANQQARRWNEPPLILGAQLGLHDFVKKILQVCPQSVAYLDTKNRSVLRVAIENGSKEIVHIIHKMARGDNPTLPSWLFSSVHQDSKNTILHLASEKCHTNEGDAVQMQDEMKWFEEVKDMIPKELVYSRNKDEKTAQEVFTESHKGMLEKCKEQLMEMGKTCSGLVAAVVFASSFSIPGEKDDKTGNPVYFHRLPFKIFSHAYVIGLSCAATSLVLFLSLVVSPYKEQQFRRAIPTKYLFACLSFAIALVAFLVSFACNMFLQIYGGQKTETKDLIVMILELTVFPIVSFLLLLYRGSNFFPSFFSRLT